MTTTRRTAAPSCPICSAPTQRAWRPFCSQKCADIDLGRWMTGAYAIATDHAPDDDRSEPPDT